jgi:hypothetical protein
MEADGVSETRTPTGEPRLRGWKTEQGELIGEVPILANVGPALRNRLEELLSSETPWEDTLEEIVGLVMEHFSTPLGELFPVLATCDLSVEGTGELRPRFDPPRTRSQRILLRMFASRDLEDHWSSLSGFRPSDLLATVSSGIISVDDIVRVIIEIAARWRGSLPLARSEAILSEPSEIDLLALRASELLCEGGSRQLVAAFLEIQGRPTSVHSAVSAWLAGEVPTELSAIVGRLAEFDLHSGLSSRSIAERIDSLLDAFDPRARLIVEQRIITDGAVTLQTLADQMRVTRERVRQLETRVVAEMMERLSSPDFLPIRWAAQEVRRALGNCFPLDEVVRDGFLERLLGAGYSDLHLNLLLFLSGPYSRRGSLVACVDLGDLRASIDAESEDDCLSPVNIDAKLAEFGIHDRFSSVVIANVGGYRRIDDAWYRWLGSLLDKAEVVLAVRGEPMTVDEVARGIDEDVSERSLRNRIHEDDRFKRIDRSRVGLAFWEADEYVSIAKSIAQVIDEHGGSCELAIVVSELEQRFSVRPSSAEAYARSPMFVVNGGQVRLRRPDELLNVRKTVARSRGCFRFMDRGVTIFQIDRDGLRGSGRQVSAGFSATLNVPPGGDRLFRGNGFHVRLVWQLTSPNGGSMGSIRDAIASVGGEEGSLLRLTFDLQRETVTAAVIDSQRGSPSMSSVEAWLGVAFDSIDEMYEQFSKMLECEPREVVEKLILRGDVELAELFPSRQVKRIAGGWKIEV